MKMTGKACVLALICGLVGSLVVPALAQQAVAPKSAAQNSEWVSRINKALQNMPAMSGRFEQRQANGAHAAGTYLIDWPDNLRFAYDVNGETVVTVKGKYVAIQEKAGGEPNWFPVSLTPLAVIRRAVADGLSANMVRDINDEGGAFSASLFDPTGEVPGVATLYFNSANDRLYAWRLVDAQNLVTLVRLRDIQDHKALDKSLFAIVENDESDDD